MSKELKNFISESDKPKKEEKTSDRGLDDKEYVKLMEKYKRARRTEGKSANRYLEKDKMLAKKGDVSDKAKVAGAYI